MKLDRKKRLNGKKKVLIGGAVAAVLVGAAVVTVYVNRLPSDGDGQGNMTAQAGDSDDNIDPDAQDVSGADGDNTQQSGQEGDGTAQDGFMPGGVGSLNVVPDIVINLDEEPGDQTAESVNLPYSIGGTELTVDKITSYDGIFIEDGSDKEISGVTSMVLTNHGDTDVEYVEVTAQQSDQTLSFKASAIPAGATIVVLDANQTGWSDEAVIQIYASATDGSSFEMSEDQIQILRECYRWKQL